MVTSDKLNVLPVTTEGRLVLLEALPREAAVRAAGRIISIPAE